MFIRRCHCRKLLKCLSILVNEKDCDFADKFEYIDEVHVHCNC